MYFCDVIVFSFVEILMLFILLELNRSERKWGAGGSWVIFMLCWLQGHHQGQSIFLPIFLGLNFFYLQNYAMNRLFLIEYW